MALINLLGGNTSGKSLPATAQERVNLYYEVLPQQDKSQIVAYNWPGTKAAYLPLPVGQKITGFYAALDSGDLWVAGTNNLYIYAVGQPYDPTVVGTVIAWPVGFTSISDKPTYFQENKASSPAELLIMRSGTLCRVAGGVANLVTMSAGGGIGLSFLAGRFISGMSNGKFAWSALNNGNSWPALNFATAETLSDGLVFQCVLRDNLILMGTSSIEFWTPSPDLNLPFAKVFAASNVGLLSETSVAIAEDSLYFVGLSSTGSLKVYRLSGYEITPISTPDIDRVLSQHYDPYSVNISLKFWKGNYITIGGHSFYVLKCQDSFGVGPGYSLAYDETTGIWTKIKSGNGPWQYNLAAQLPSPVEDANSIRSLTGVADSEGRAIYYIRDDILTESTGVQTFIDTLAGSLLAITRPQLDNGTWQEKTLICPHIFDGNSLNKLRLHRVRLDMENPGLNAQFRVGLSISRDGGKTYGTEMLINLDTAGGAGLRAEWRRLGIGRDFVFKFRFPDSGKIAIIGAYVETSLANK